MSQSIWTQCAAKFEPARLVSRPWRVVESQYVNSTRKLVDSDEEQELLENLIEDVKPELPTDLDCDGLHYLLSTPFRHPPLHHGSRFRTPAEGGVWYGSESRRTALAEKAYYQLLFLEGTEADLTPITQPLTLFRADVRTTLGADLTTAPFAEHESAISSQTTYRYSQPLGAALRVFGIEAFRFVSARDPDRGTNLGLFAPAFASKRPTHEQTWRSVVEPERVELMRASPVQEREREVFTRDAFLVDGTLPAPGLA